MIFDFSSPGKQPDPRVHLYMACCLYALTQYEQAETSANKCEVDDPLKKRILFHVAHKRSNDSLMMQMHAALSDSCEDQL